MNIHRPEIMPGTGDAVKLYVPESPGSKWGIAVETHPDTSWVATRWNGEVRMTEDMLRSFVEHAAVVLRMSVIATPPASVPSMDTETVPVAVCGLPDYATPTVVAEPATEAWR